MFKNRLLFRHKQQYGGYQRERGVGGGRRGYRRRLDLGCGHRIQHTDDAVKKCTPETYIILLTNVTPMNSVKN